jgi:hypothetical protein
MFKELVDLLTVNAEFLQFKMEASDAGKAVRSCEATPLLSANKSLAQSRWHVGSSLQ